MVLIASRACRPRALRAIRNKDSPKALLLYQFVNQVLLGMSVEAKPRKSETEVLDSPNGSMPSGNFGAIEHHDGE
jgi:hypothetical protein